MKATSSLLLNLLCEFLSMLQVILIFDLENQDVGSGGSGCGCSATVLSSYYLPRLRSGKLKRILFVPTGALLSPVSFNEGHTVPGIAHGIVLEGK